MKTSTKDAKGNNLRLGYRVEDTGSSRQGKVVGLSSPWSVTVEWDNGLEETVRAESVTHLSKVGG